MAMSADRPDMVNPQNDRYNFLHRWGVKASTTIYKGMHCALSGGDADKLKESTDTSGEKFVGVAQEYVKDTVGTDGNKTVVCIMQGIFANVTLSLSATASGSGTTINYTNFPFGHRLFAGADGETVTTSAYATNDVTRGFLVEITSSTNAEIKMFATNVLPS